jgi:hypothetical protein
VTAQTLQTSKRLLLDPLVILQPLSLLFVENGARLSPDL